MRNFYEADEMSEIFGLENLMKAESRERPPVKQASHHHGHTSGYLSNRFRSKSAQDSPPSSPQVTSVVKQQKERACCSPRGSRPAPKVSTNFLEIWEREAAPAESSL